MEKAIIFGIGLFFGLMVSSSLNNSAKDAALYEEKYEETAKCLEDYKEAYEEVVKKAGNAAWIIETEDESNYREVMDKMSEAFSYIDGIGANEPYCL